MATIKMLDVPKELHKNSKCKLVKFDTTKELVSYLLDEKHPNGLKTHAIDYVNEEFCSLSWDDSLKFLTEGIDIPNITDIRKAFTEKLGFAIKETESLRYDVQGSFVDVGLYLSGEPECMVEFTKEHSPKSAIKIIVNMRASAWVEQQYIFNRACAVSSLIDSLKEHYDIELSVIIPITDDLQKVEEWMMEYVIDTENGYSFNQLLFTTHPAFLRRIYFRVAEVLSQKKELSGYGRGLGNAESWLPSICEGKQVLYFPEHKREEYERCYNNLENSVASVLEIAKKNNLELS